MLTVIQIFLLLAIFQAKHFLADYPLQSGFMLKKFLPGWGFFWPLAAHCGVHAAMTLAICLYVNPALWWLAVVDFVVHFIMDRIKAGPKYLGRFKALSANEFFQQLKVINGDIDWDSQNPEDRKSDVRKAIALKTLRQGAKRKMRGNVLFWWSLGLDQSVHHLTHYLIIFMLVVG